MRELIDRYGAMKATPRGGERRRGQEFNGLIADTLRHWGADDVEANIRGMDGRDEIDVAFRLGGIRYLLEAKWEAKPISDEPVGKLAGRLRSRLGGPRGILLSMSGFTRHAAPAAERGDQPSVLLADRSHFEAMLSGLVSPDVLLQELERHLAARGGVSASLTDLMLHHDPPPSMASIHDGAPVNDVAGGITARAVMVGEAGWPECDSLNASMVSDSLLISTPDGIVDLAIGTGSSRWALPMAGCHGATLATSDGSLLTISSFAAIRWTGKGIDILGGALTGNATLLVGPDGAMWAFQNTGENHNSEVSLIQLGDSLGTQTSHAIEFPAWNAAWLEDKRFYLAADGYSAVVDLARSNQVPQESWQISPQAGPRSIVVSGPSTVLTFARAQGVNVSLVQISTKTGSTGQLLQVHANRALGMTRGRNGRLYLLADQRGNERFPRPVLLEVLGVT
ncbi:MAG TPA: restriction endonuclease [Candidatus Limnocylindrales bacterium]|nr:restriction endonuclease [Candidatus Limnocylindrales bacterium]